MRSPYLQRFGTPRQANLHGDTGPVEAQVELDPGQIPPAALEGVEGFERLWLITVLHLATGWGPRVVPTRGPKVKRGLFATRTPNRPVPLGLSAVELIRVEGLILWVRGVDLLDGTPVLDFKPYVPHADAFPTSRAGWLEGLPPDEPDRPTRPPRRLRSPPSGTAQTDQSSAGAAEGVENGHDIHLTRDSDPGTR